MASATLKLDATGVLTAIRAAGVTASDLVSGDISPVVYMLTGGTEQPVPGAGLPSGVHQLIWKATDANGNTATAMQTLEITPQANFIAAQAASAGDQVTVTVHLTGLAVSYPVAIPYSINTQASPIANDGADHDATNGEILIQSGTTGSFTFNVAEKPVLNGAGEGELVFDMGMPENAVLGAATHHKVTISGSNIAPAVTIKMTQGEAQITRVAKDAGNVLITALANDSATQALAYDWGRSDSTLVDLVLDSDNATFELDPSSLDEGSYKIAVTITDDGSPVAQTSVDAIFLVIAGATPIADSDGDGIEDSKDFISEPNRLTSDENSNNAFVLESEAGTTLKLGPVALKQQQSSASIDLTGLPAIPAQYESTVTKIYDFEISGVVQGDSMLVVIPQHNPIPANAVYLKLDGNEWKPFIENEGNAIYSAFGSSNGNCPSVGNPQYTPTLKEGDYCMQLKITDGGQNDADEMINGHIVDPGVVIGPKVDVADDTEDKNSHQTTESPSHGGGVTSWFLMIVLLGFRFVKHISGFMENLRCRSMVSGRDVL